TSHLFQQQPVRRCLATVRLRTVINRRNSLLDRYSSRSAWPSNGSAEVDIRRVGSVADVLTTDVARSLSSGNPLSTRRGLVDTTRAAALAGVVCLAAAVRAARG